MYGSTFLLVSNQTSELFRLLVSQVIAHELSHSWMGDTITTPWWSSTYLQEGFARWLQYVAIDSLFPEFNILRGDGSLGYFLFAYNIMWDSLDSYGGEYPVVLTEDEVSGSDDSLHNGFSGITYGKGGAINAQVDHWLGGQFSLVLSEFVSNYEFTNPTVTDLLHFFARRTNFNATTLLRPWLERKGYPVVTIQYNPSTHQLDIRQAPIHDSMESDPWWCPLRIYTDTGMVITQFNTTTTSVPFMATHNSYFILNINHTEFYPVNYGENAIRWATVWDVLDRIPTTQDTDFIVHMHQAHLVAQNSHATVVGPLTLLDFFDHTVDSKPRGDLLWDNLEPLWTQKLFPGLRDTRIEKTYSELLRNSFQNLAFNTKNPNIMFAAVFFGSYVAVQQGLKDYHNGNYTRASLYAAGSNGTPSDTLLLRKQLSDPNLGPWAFEALAATSCDVSAVTASQLPVAEQPAFWAQIAAKTDCAVTVPLMKSLSGVSAATLNSEICPFIFQEDLVAALEPVVQPVSPLCVTIMRTNVKFVKTNNLKPAWLHDFLNRH